MEQNRSIPAIRGIQGGRAFFTTNLPISLLRTLLQENLDFDSERSQRDLDAKHSNSIARYVLANQSSYVLGALTFAINKEPKFTVKNSGENDPWQIGILDIAKDLKISSLDGQHRREALITAAYELESLNEESIAVLIYVESGLENRRQMFSDMNSTSKKVSKALNILFDKRDPFAKAAKIVVESHELLKGRVENYSGSIRGDSNMFFTLSGVKDAIRNLEVGGSGRVADPEKYSTEYLVKQATIFFDFLIESRPEFRQAMGGRSELLALRENSILLSSTTLRVIAGALYKYKKLHNLIEMPKSQASLITHFSKIDFNKDSKIFLQAGFIKPGSTTPQARNQEMGAASSAIFSQLD